MHQQHRTTEASGTLIELVYELLDAHDDTARLADTTGCGEQWAAHLEYLRGLQRVAREVLAQTIAI